MSTATSTLSRGGAWNPVRALRRLQLFLGVIAAALLLCAPAQAQVDGNALDDADVAVQMDGTDVCLTLTNRTNFTLNLNVATYQVVVKPVGEHPTHEELDGQPYVASTSVTVPAGVGQTATVCLPIPQGVQPVCLFQIDVFYGPVITGFKDSDYYTGRIVWGDILPANCDEIGAQGCTPGYWKNHEESWAGTGYALADTLEDVFNVPDSYGLDDISMHAALSLGGGPSVADKAALLLHHACAALLNAAHADVDYAMTTAQIIAECNAALASGDKDAMTELKNKLDAYNNGGCTLN